MRRQTLTLILLAAAALALGAPALAHPGSGIAVDRRGRIYFVDTGSGLWTIDASGALISIPAPRFHWLTLDEENRLASVRLPSGSAGEVTRVGSKPAALLASDYPLVMASDGSLYYPKRVSTGVLDVVRVSASGRGVVVTRVPLPYVNGLAAGPQGSLYYTEDAAIRRIDANGRITTVAEKVAPTGCASIPGAAGSGPLLRGLAVETDGTVYAAASGCGRVVKVAPSGGISTLIQIESPWSPTAVAISGKDVYVLEYLHTEAEDRRQWIPRVRKVSADGKSAILATVTRD